MRAVKGNKVYNITESQRKSYQDAGFDILDSEGKTVAFGRGKTVPYEEYMELQEENAALKSENENLRAEIARLEQETSEAEKEQGLPEGGEAGDAVPEEKKGKKSGKGGE